MSDELFRAVLDGDAARHDALLDAGADVNAPRRALWTVVLHRAAEGSPELAFRALFRVPKEEHAEFLWTWTPLLLAAARGEWELSLALLRRGARADVADEQGRTPLLFAARAGHEVLVRE